MKTVKTRSRLSVVGVAVATSALLAACDGGTSGAESYPDKNITVIVPVPAGSSTDLSTRIITPCLSEELDKKILVENRDGGSGAVGNAYFSQAAPDGYTLVSTTAANAVLPGILEDSVPFSAEDFTPLGTIGEAPIVMLVAPDSPAEKAADLLSPDRDATLLIGVPGATSVPGVVVSGLIGNNDLNAETVPFDGNGNTVQALRSGEVDAIFVSADTGVTLPAIDGGEVKALAVAVDEEVSYLPEVPTLASQGFTEVPYAMSFWFLAAQPDVDQEIVEKVSAAVETCMDDENVQERLGETAVPETFIDGPSTKSNLQDAEEEYTSVLKGS